MNSLVNGIVVVLTAIVGVAILSVIVSQKSQTAQILTAAQNAFSGILKTAEGN